MTKYTPNINAKQLLVALKKAKMIQPRACTKLEHFIQAKHQHKELPLYVRVLVGIGALISSAFFIHSLAIIIALQKSTIYSGALSLLASPYCLPKCPPKRKTLWVIPF